LKEEVIMFRVNRSTTNRSTTGPVLLIPLIALIVVWVYACEGTAPTESSGANADPAFQSQGQRTKLSSSFDTDFDGWTIVGDGDNAHTGFWPLSLQPSYDPTGGNPGGAVYAVDRGRGMSWFWQAPPKFLGNRLGAYGGTLEFDIRIEPASPTFSYADVVLAGGGLSILIDAGPEPTTTQWTHYSVPLDANAGWRNGHLAGTPTTKEEIRAVLKNLTVLLIRGEYVGEGGDTGYLDNVRILPPGQSD
jgi:alkaline phosphatase D